MIRDRICQIQAAEPPIGKIEMDFIAKATLGPNPHDVANQQHPDHQFGIGRGSPDGAVERRQMTSDVCKINEAINGPQQMILRYVVFKIEPVKQRSLHSALIAHHAPTLHSQMN